ncbi:MAG: hypothetical protein NC924_09565 [Candidatus Omnitrophica bacterium]|nr:hypothetical protein [Candidatus Omnitrophota bacterium]
MSIESAPAVACVPAARSEAAVLSPSLSIGCGEIRSMIAGTTAHQRIPAKPFRYMTDPEKAAKRAEIMFVLQECGWQMSDAAARLRMSGDMLRIWMKRFNIARPRNYENFDMAAFVRQLAATGGDIDQVVREFGISKSTAQEWLYRLGLDADKIRSGQYTEEKLLELVAAKQNLPRREAIIASLQRQQGDVAAAAETLGLDPEQLASLMEEKGIDAAVIAEEEERRILVHRLKGVNGDVSVLAREAGRNPAVLAAQVMRLSIDLDAIKMERKLLIAALTYTGGNQQEAGKLIGLSKNTMTKYVNAHRLGDFVQAVKDDHKRNGVREAKDQEYIGDEIKALRRFLAEKNSQSIPPRKSRIEKNALIRALRRTQGETVKAARLLEMHPRTFQAKMKLYGLDGIPVNQLQEDIPGEENIRFLGKIFSVPHKFQKRHDLLLAIRDICGWGAVQYRARGPLSSRDRVKMIDAVVALLLSRCEFADRGALSRFSEESFDSYLHSVVAEEMFGNREVARGASSGGVTLSKSLRPMAASRDAVAAMVRSL